MAYRGSVAIASGLVGLNGRDFPLVHESSIQVGDNAENRLDVLLDDMQIEIDQSIKSSGGIMNGPLLLTATPTEDNEATNKKYVDSLIDASMDNAAVKIDEDELKAMLQEVLGE